MKKKLINKTMDTKTELLLDYQEMAILALRKEVERLTAELLAKTEQAEWLENRLLTNKLSSNDFI
jgi:uncharacterized small protein (DUF1192 family)